VCTFETCCCCEKTALRRVLIVLMFWGKNGTKLLVHMLKVGLGVLVV